ncbi:MAG: glycosyltransferase [Roseovarius sp.]
MPNPSSDRRAQDAPDAGHRPGQHVTILLGVHGAAPFLTEQLESLAAQTHADWSVILSFDCDSRAARAQAEDFAARYPRHAVCCLDGPGEGFVANYLYLLGQVPEDADYVAFCDHDDVWLPQKLERALGFLAGESGAAMVCGRTIICDEALNRFAESPRFRHPPQFRNALLQSIGGANTMLLNRAAFGMLGAARPHAARTVAHDWWAYQVLAGMGARVIYDPEPMMLYRQHGGNLFGTNATWRARAQRLWQFLRGRLRDWSGRTAETLWPLRDRLTPENRQVLEDFAAAREARLVARVRLFRRAGIFRQTRGGQLFFWVAVVFRLI